MEGSRTLLCSSIFQRARERLSSKFVNNLDTRLQRSFARPAVENRGCVTLRGFGDVTKI